MLETQPSYDLELPRVMVADFVARHGWDELLTALDVKASARGLGLRDLYSVSTEWARDESIKVMKARGARGDLLVRLT